MLRSFARFRVANLNRVYPEPIGCHAAFPAGEPSDSARFPPGPLVHSHLARSSRLYQSGIPLILINNCGKVIR